MLTSIAVAVVAGGLVLSGCSDLPGTGTAPSFGGATVDDRTYATGQAIAPLELPAAAGGDGALTYSLDPDVPGLTFDRATRTLGGAPTRADTYAMTYTVTDADDNSGAGDADTLTFAITVQVPAPTDTAPSFGGATVDDRTYATGQAIAPLELPAAAGGDGALTYSLDPDIPGLTFDRATRTLGGAPTQAGTYRMTYTVTDADDNTGAGDADTLTFIITVQPELAPPRFRTTVPDKSYSVGRRVELALPAADGGSGTLTYSLRPTIGGLTFDAGQRTLRGVPVKATTAAMTYTVRDEQNRTDELTFTILIQTTPSILRYRGSGDQVFVLNPDDAYLHNARFTLQLGDASTEVYVISTNTTDRYPANLEIARLDPGTAATHGRRAPAEDGPEPLASGVSPERAVTEFNDSLPRWLPRWEGSAGGSGRLRTQSQGGVAEGDRFTFPDITSAGFPAIPSTARKVVTDGAATAAFWVADRDWGPNCRGAGPCVTGEMVDAMAGRFFRPGAGNDIHDWVTAVYGEPWGPHRDPGLIPPEAADEIHVVLFDIGGDGAPGPQECRIIGFYTPLHNHLQTASPPFDLSAERLVFFMDSAYFAVPEGRTWDVTDRRPSRVIGVLAHEFQHVIHFYQKQVLRDAASETWLNEMASEVAEDLVAHKAMVSGPRGVAHDDPTAGAPGNFRGRFPLYNTFNDMRVTTWHGVLADYAINYALGAYLARTYGGAELFRAIVQSDRSGVDAIEAALAATGHDVSFGDVLADWAVATLLSDNTAATHPYRYNPGTWSTSRSGGERFRLGSINLYHYRSVPPEHPCIGPGLANRPAQEGPRLRSLQSFNARTQPPHSNMYATLGRTTGTLHLRVTTEGIARITVVVKE